MKAGDRYYCRPGGDGRHREAGEEEAEAEATELRLSSARTCRCSQHSLEK